MTEPHLDADALIAWIAEQTDRPVATVRAVLELEDDYMAAAGIAIRPDYTPVYYKPEDTTPGLVDTERLARDAVQFLGVPIETAAEIFAKEHEFMVLRGLA